MATQRYFNESDRSSFLAQGYKPVDPTDPNDAYLISPGGERIRVKPGSGTTAATRAGDTSTLVSPTGQTSQFRNPASYKPLTGDLQVDPEQVAALQAAGEKAPGGTQTDISQPSGFYKVPTGATGPGGPIFDVFSGSEHIQDPNDPRLKGVNIPNLPTGTAPKGFASQFPASPFEKGFENAAAAGVGVPETPGGESAILTEYVSGGQGGPGTAIVQGDPYLSNLVKTFQDYMDPKNQRASLTETYQKMLKDSGIQALDTELLNMKNVIEGSEDDIRTEITKAGGFATESQVLALTNARNKQLIKNYNNLLEARNSKERYLETALNLESQDRQAADQRFNTLFNMSAQIAEYGQRMQQNAVQRLQWLESNIGFDGIYASVKDDPNAVRLVERTLGMPAGSLAQGAAQAMAARTTATQDAALDTQIKQAQLAKMRADIGSANTAITEIQGRKYLVNTKTGTIVKEIAPAGTAGAVGDTKLLAQQKSQIDLTNGLIGSGDLGGAVGANRFARMAPFSVFSGGKQNFIAGVEQLRSGLNLQSLIDAKAKGATFGALSDQELQVLSNSATKIGSWATKDKSGNVTGYNASESAFKAELDKINNFTKLDYILKGGNPMDVGATVQPDGTIWVRNSDGSMTQL